MHINVFIEDTSAYGMYILKVAVRLHVKEGYDAQMPKKPSRIS